MDISDLTPIVIFDNRCYVCMKFAKTVNFLARGSLTMVGHYSSLGKEIRNKLLDESALDMFWLIDEKNAYGGRAALLPLVRYIISSGCAKPYRTNMGDSCDQDCKTVKAAFLRSTSLFSNSKKITLKSK